MPGLVAQASISIPVAHAHWAQRTMKTPFGFRASCSARGRNRPSYSVWVC